MAEPAVTRNERASRIRTIFTTKRTYTLVEAASLLGIDEPVLIREVESGDIASLTDNRYLPWEEVAFLALRTWPLNAIFEALGADSESHLPELLRPTTIVTTLPTYQVRMLEVLAEDQQLDLSTFLQLHLLDLASAESPKLAGRISGFIEVLRFPYGGVR